MPATPSGWTVNFSDDFEGSSLNSSKWRIRNDSGQSNNDGANLSSNVVVSGSVVKLYGSNAAVSGKPYGTSYIDTIGKFSQKYGRWEGKIRFPMGTHAYGFWPALWMRPDNGGDGELDLMEAWPSRKQISATVWQNYSSGSAHPAGQFPAAAFDENWHTYTLDWFPGSLVFYFDGVQVHAPSYSKYPWMVDNYDNRGAYNWRICLQIGGSWGGPPTGSTDWSIPFELDWVRVMSPSSGGTVTPPPTGGTPAAPSDFQTETIVLTTPRGYHYAGTLDDGEVYWNPIDITGSGTDTPPATQSWYRYTAGADGTLTVTQPGSSGFAFWDDQGDPDVSDADVASTYDVDSDESAARIPMSDGSVTHVLVQDVPDISYTFASDGASEGIRLNVLTPTIPRVPYGVNVSLDGAEPHVEVYFTTTGHVGNLGMIIADDTGIITLGTVAIPASVPPGSQTLTATQGLASDSQSYFIGAEFSGRPGDLDADDDPGLSALGGDVVRWRFKDPLGETYTFARNPSTWVEPLIDRQLTVEHTTASEAGQPLIWEGGEQGTQFTFEGYVDTQEQYEAMNRFLALRHRFWLTDHRNRIWSVVLHQIDWTPRRNQGVDWSFDYSATATALTGPEDL